MFPFIQCQCFDKRRGVYLVEKVSVFIKIRVLFWPEISALGVFFNFDNERMRPPKYPSAPPRAEKPFQELFSEIIRYSSVISKMYLRSGRLLRLDRNGLSYCHKSTPTYPVMMLTGDGGMISYVF